MKYNLFFKSICITYIVLFVNFDSLSIEKPPTPFVQKQKAEISDKDTQVTKSTSIELKTIIIASSTNTKSIPEILCNLINYNQNIMGIKCSTKITDNTLESIALLDSNKVDFIMIPGNIIIDHIINDMKRKKSVDAQKIEYEFILSLYPQTLNIITKQESKINDFIDLKGKILDVGQANSASKYTFQQILKYLNLQNTKFADISYTQEKDRIDALCNNKVDASIMFFGTPNKLINKLTRFCETKIISIDPHIQDIITGSNKFLDTSIIPGGIYLSNPKDVSSIESPLLMISKDYIDQKIPYSLIKLLISNIQTLKKIHPAFDIHPIKNLSNNKSLIPYNPGAELAFKEKNLIQ
ncbi:MAG: TRAP transporter TAXI family solute receptor [Candidatus Midichloriaceae bacterium]|jgi:TRAP transporter TAXI family solute receptor